MKAKRYVANPVVSCREEEGGAAVFNPDTDDMAIINPTGLVIWDFLDSPRTAAQVAAHLIEKFRGVSLEQATGDAEGFLESLLPDFILETEGMDDV
jgi:hypothetical protein